MKEPASFEAFWPDYLRAHSNPTTRALHLGGTVAGVACAAVFLATSRPGWALAGLLVAYGAAWLGHVLVEGNVPKTFTHPLWSIRGDFRMLRLALAGRLADEVAAQAAENRPTSPEP